MKTTAIIIIVIIVVLLAALIWYFNAAPAPTENQPTGQGGPQQNEKGAQNSSLSTSPSDSSEPALDKDIQTVNNGLNDLQTDINSSQSE